MASLFEMNAPCFDGKALGVMTYVAPTATGTLTPAQTINAILETEQTAAITLTTPTAAALKDALSGPAVGTTFDLIVINSGSNHAVTIEGGTGVTVVGVATTVQFASKVYKGVFTNVGSTPTLKLFGLGSTAAAQS